MTKIATPKNSAIGSRIAALSKISNSPRERLSTTVNEGSNTPNFRQSARPRLWDVRGEFGKRLLDAGGQHLELRHLIRDSLRHGLECEPWDAAGVLKEED